VLSCVCFLQGLRQLQGLTCSVRSALLSAHPPPPPRDTHFHHPASGASRAETCRQRCSLVDDACRARLGINISPRKYAIFELQRARRCRHNPRNCRQPSDIFGWPQSLVRHWTELKSLTEHEGQRYMEVTLMPSVTKSRVCSATMTASRYGRSKIIHESFNIKPCRFLCTLYSIDFE